MQKFHVFTQWSAYTLMVGLVVACGGGSGAPGPGTQPGTVIGALGGKITSADGTVELIIPAGALAGDTTIMATVPAILPPATGVVAAVDFQPDGLTFLADCTLTMHYNPAMLPEGYDPDHLLIAVVQGGTWVLAPAVFDPVAETLTAMITHFSTHGALVPRPTSYLAPIYPVGGDPDHVVSLGGAPNKLGPVTMVRLHSWIPPLIPVVATIRAGAGEVFYDAQVVGDRLYFLGWSDPSPALSPDVFLRIYSLSTPAAPSELVYIPITSAAAVESTIAESVAWADICCIFRPKLYVTRGQAGRPRPGLRGAGPYRDPRRALRA